MSFRELHDGDCRYCNIGAKEPLLLGSEAGSVVPSWGAMVEGWSLVFPSTHVLSLAQLSPQDWDGFSELLSEARSAIEAVYGTSVTFEHGSAGTGRPAACGVDHAHMHIVPIAVDLRELISDCAEDFGDFQWSSIRGRVDEMPGEDYLYVEDITGRWLTRSPWLPSQVVRRALARFLGLEVWDWKQDAHLDIVAATRSRLEAA